MTRRNIFVTGGTGYIGSHVVLSCLLQNKYRICTIDNYHNSSPKAGARISQIALSALPSSATQEDKDATEIKVFQGDLTRKADIDKVFDFYKDKGGVWGVIHIAAHKAVGESMEQPVQYLQNNITGLVNLLDSMKSHSCTRIVYSSSATVYGEPEKMPITEDMPLKPQSVYGRTKYMGEIMIKDCCDCYGGEWAALSLRYFNPAGAHPSGLIGEDPRGKPLNLLPLLSAMAVGRYKADGLKVFGTDYPTNDGACVRDYLHVMDLADGHVTALEAIESGSVFSDGKSWDLGFGEGTGKFKAYNLGTGRGYSALEIIEAMRKATGYDYKPEKAGRRAGDVPWLIADPSRAQKDLKFKATRDLETMCRDLWNWQSLSPQGYDTPKQ